MKKNSTPKTTEKKKKNVGKVVSNQSNQDITIEKKNNRIRREVSLQKKKEILLTRSKELAGELHEVQFDKGYFEVVEFVLSFEKYAVESFYVSEVIPLKDFTPVPCTPSFVLGITNIRGRIISIIDIKRFFNLPEKGLSNLNRIIVVHTPEMELGILADSIIGVRLLSRQDIQSTLPTLPDIGLEFLQGLTKDRIIILNVEKILSHPKIIVHQEVDA